jgi:hypothetical protein
MVTGATAPSLSESRRWDTIQTILMAQTTFPLTMDLTDYMNLSMRPGKMRNTLSQTYYEQLGRWTRPPDMAIGTKL